jgi:hypothetical protein
MKMLKFHNTSMVMLIPGYRISISLPFAILCPHHHVIRCSVLTNRDKQNCDIHADARNFLNFEHQHFHTGPKFK